jgi:hypothetical protein
MYSIVKIKLKCKWSIKKYVNKLVSKHPVELDGSCLWKSGDFLRDPRVIWDLVTVT